MPYPALTYIALPCLALYRLVPPGPGHQLLETQLRTAHSKVKEAHDRAVAAEEKRRELIASHEEKIVEFQLRLKTAKEGEIKPGIESVELRGALSEQARLNSEVG